MKKTLMSKIEKIVILAILIGLGVLFVLMMFTKTDPNPIPQPNQYENSIKELEESNRQLDALIDSIETVDSLHLIELRENQIELNNKKDEIRKIIKFLPDTDSKFRDSLWAVYLKD